VQNNILERLHTAIMVEFGAAGNVVAYNYEFGAFDSGALNSVLGGIVMHGGHPQFNLFEGNITVGIGSDSVWGSLANDTWFRNWVVGTTKACNPTSGRGTVVCTPLGTQGSTGVNGWWEFQASKDVDPDFLDILQNFVGDVIGSAAQQSLIAYGSPQPSVNLVNAVCGPSPCGGTSRPYDANNYGYTFGYGIASDTGAGGTAAGAGCSGSFTYTCHSLTPYTTAFLHGEYSNISSATIWATGVTQTLPASFYLSTKPNWWNSTIPFPGIGPDVTGGTGPGGHAYINPAQACYQNVMGGTDGTGGPLTFNASTCYPSPPTPASALTATPH